MKLSRGKTKPSRIMIRTHLKFATRVFLKDKFFSTLNILGLGLGIAVSIILLLVLQHDLTYDKHHLQHEQIFRLGAHEQATGVDFRTARSARELGHVLQQELPEVRAFVRAESWDRTLVKPQEGGTEEKAFYEDNIVRADSNYFDLFTHAFVAGDPKTCLTEINSVVLTESTAKKYFGNVQVLNRALVIHDEQWKVTGIIKDVPDNTHLKFDILLSQLPDRQWVMQHGEIKSEAFWNPDVYTYLLMPPHYNEQDFYTKFPAIYTKYFKSFGDQVGGTYTPILEPLAGIHFNSTLDADEPRGNKAYLYAFTGIGLFIIVLACINYMNLSTAKSVNRAAEIAMKKTLGSGKGALVLAFLAESLLLSFISLVLAIVLVHVVLGATSFNQLIEKDLHLDFADNPLLLAGSIAITIGIGLVSGLYPAFYLPNIPTIKALKGAFKNRKSSHVLRRVLITTQFAISIFVVVCTLLMQDQINYIRNTDLGFDHENVLLLPIQDTLVEHNINGIKNEFLQNPHIVAATTAYTVPGYNAVDGQVFWAEKETGMVQQAFNVLYVGDDYLSTMGLSLLQGRDFHTGAEAEINQRFIINEATAKLMGWQVGGNDQGKSAIGKKVKFFHGEKPGEVIGVVKDFNFSSLHNPIEPLLIIKGNGSGGFLHLKVKGENLPETMNYIKSKWAGFDPNHPFEYFFLDQRFNEQYRTDEIQHKLLAGLSYICIFISLLGLLGLSAFSAAQRTKEIGVRKVHGASIPHIIFLLYRDVMYLVLIAAILIIPVSYYSINEWLENFAYKTSINFMTFGLVAFMALVFAFLTVAFHSLKTARTNPIESLKYE